jgi:2-hydroxychromene-2-carboxylate isomerase
MIAEVRGHWFRSQKGDRIIDEAEALGVPTMVFNGELFWGGNRIDMLIERIGSYIESEGVQAD